MATTTQVTLNERELWTLISLLMQRIKTLRDSGDYPEATADASLKSRLIKAHLEVTT